MGIFGKLFGRGHDEVSSELPMLPEGDPWAAEQGSWDNPGLAAESNPNLGQNNPNLGQNWGSRANEMEKYDVPDMNPQVSGERFSGSISPKDIQLIMSKLDLISSRLDNLSRRLEASEMGKREKIY
mgnify:FL=1